MAVTTTTIAGTDSLSGSRITINDNFKTLTDALNSVLLAYDIVSGRFDNSTVGSANDIITNGIQVAGSGLTTSVTIQNGNLSLLVGDISLAQNFALNIGTLLELDKHDLKFATSAASYPAWDLRDPTVTQNVVGGVVLPSLSAAGQANIGTAGSSVPANGTLIFSDGGPTAVQSSGGIFAGGGGTGGGCPLKIWWTSGPSGATWYNILAFPS